MRKITHLEIAIFSYLLTFGFSNSLFARDNSKLIYEFSSVASTSEKLLNREIFSKVLYSDNNLEISSFNRKYGDGILVDDSSTSNFNLNKLYSSEKPSKSSFSQDTQQKSANNDEDTREKIRISFKSPKGYNRQLLVGADINASNGYDMGFDAPLNENNVEDMFWIIGNNEFVIQGVSNFDPNQVLPIGIIVDQEGEIIIQLDSVQNIGDDKRIYLKDKRNDVIHDLRKSGYKTSSEAGYFLDRFEIVFYNSLEDSHSEPTEENGTELSENIIAIVPVRNPKLEAIDMSLRYSNLSNEIQILNPKKLLINSVRIYKMDGALFESFREIKDSKETRLLLKNYNSGVYIVNCFFSNTVISKNFIIRN